MPLDKECMTGNQSWYQIDDRHWFGASIRAAASWTAAVQNLADIDPVFPFELSQHWVMPFCSDGHNSLLNRYSGNSVASRLSGVSEDGELAASQFSIQTPIQHARHAHLTERNQQASGGRIKLIVIRKQVEQSDQQVRQ